MPPSITEGTGRPQLLVDHTKTEVSTVEGGGNEDTIATNAINTEKLFNNKAHDANGYASWDGRENGYLIYHFSSPIQISMYTLTSWDAALLGTSILPMAVISTLDPSQFLKRIRLAIPIIRSSLRMQARRFTLRNWSCWAANLPEPPRRRSLLQFRRWRQRSCMRRKPRHMKKLAQQFRR